MLKKLVSQLFGPKDFSVGLIQEMLITLCKFGFSPDMAKQITNAKSGMAEKIVEIFAGILEATLDDWRRFYKQIFGLDVDFDSLLIPERHEGFDWLEIVHSSLTIQKLLRKCAELFWINISGCFQTFGSKGIFLVDKSAIIYGLDEFCKSIKSDRNPDSGTYAIWVRSCVKDDPLNQQRIKDLKKGKCLGITLEESLLLDLFYFWKHYWESKKLPAGSLCFGSHVIGHEYIIQDQTSCFNSLYIRYEDFGPASNKSFPVYDVVF
jgi:hypothetical protein